MDIQMKKYVLKSLVVTTTASMIFGFIGETFAQAQETNFENGIKIQQDKVS